MKTRFINIVGGDAYSATGGIQAFNRFVVRELEAAGLLRKAFFLWDNELTATQDGLEMMKKGKVRFYGLHRFRFIKDLIWHAMRHPTDRWLCTHINYAFLGLALTLFSRSRLALSVYADEIDKEFSRLKRFSLGKVPFVIAISRYTKNKAIKKGAAPSGIHILYLGADDPIPNYLPKNKSDKMLLFVGRMDERYKGQAELLDAMTLLRERHPGLRLNFVGGGRVIGEWQAEAQRRDLTATVSFSGRVSDQELYRAYEEATIFIMPSENEGFGIVYAEAMARGLPCIGSDRDAACEVIAHGESGWCVPAGNSTALFDAINSLLESPDLRRRMGLASRRRFLENFAADKYRQRLLATMQTWQAFCT